MSTDLVKQKSITAEREHSVRLYHYKSPQRGFHKSDRYESWDLVVDNGQVFRVTHRDKDEAFRAFDLLDTQTIQEIERLENLKERSSGEHEVPYAAAKYSSLKGDEQHDSDN